MPAWANSLRDPISKIPNTKRADGVAQGLGPEFNTPNTAKRERAMIKLKSFCTSKKTIS
jgi:hypothetical protein